MLAESIIAGFVISFGAIAYLFIDNMLISSVCIGLTLMSIVYYDLDLFTGHGGLLTAQRESIIEGIIVYIGNNIGVMWMALLIKLAPEYNAKLAARAIEIAAARGSNMWTTNFILSVLCGMLLYAGAIGYRKTNIYVMSLLTAILCVMSDYQFFLTDTFFYWVANWEYGYMIIPTLVGNIIGSNIFPWIRRRSPRFHREIKDPLDDNERILQRFVSDIQNLYQKNTDTSDTSHEHGRDS